MTIHVDIARDANVGRSPAARLNILKSKAGLDIWLFEDHTRPMITMSFGFKGGSAQDPVDKPGLSDIMAAMLVEGAGDLDAVAFQTAMADKAITIDFSTERDNFIGSLRTLTRHAGHAFDLLRLALAEPRFDEAAMERVVARSASTLRFLLTDPSTVARRLFDETAFPDHAYGRGVFSDLAILPTFTCDDLESLHHRTIARDELAIVIVGDIGPEQALRDVDRIFGALPAAADLTRPAEVSMRGTGIKLVAALDLPQSTIQFGRPAIPRHDPDFMAAIVVNHCLGGGIFSSRLFREVREKRGLCYSVYSQTVDYDHTAIFTGATAVKNDRVVEALDVISSEIELLRTSSLSADELMQAKRYLTGSYALRFDTSAKVARIFLGLRLNGYEPSWVDRRNVLVNAVSPDDVERVIARLMGDGRLLYTVAGAPVGM